MSEKIYTRLLRLYPSSFRKKYEGEALQLIRDRLRDERGFFKRARLWWDLVADVLTALPSAYRNSYAVTEAAPLSLNPAGIPSFKILEEEPLGLGSILVGGTLSLIALAAFALLLSQSIAHHPLAGLSGRMSPIESVMQRLNSGPAPDSAASNLRDATAPASAPMSGPQAQPSTPGASTPTLASSGPLRRRPRMPAPNLKLSPSRRANRTHRPKCRSTLLLSGKASQEHPRPCLTSPWIMVTHSHLLGIPAAASPLIFRSRYTSSLPISSRPSRPNPRWRICPSGSPQITSRFMQR